MIASRHVLGSLLVIVLAVSIVHQAECRLLNPSVLQKLLTDARKIGKITVDLLGRRRLATSVPRNVLVDARRVEYALNNLRWRNRAKARVARRQMTNAFKRIRPRF